MTREALERDLLAAHEAGDLPRLVTLYTQAADVVEGEARAFFLTQAYVFALEVGHPTADRLHTRLADMGHDE